MVALVRGVHGLNGAVRAEVLTDRPEDRFVVGNTLFREGDDRALTIASAEAIADGPGWRVRFARSPRATPPTRSAAPTSRPWSGADEDLARGAYYWHEVIGCTVRGVDGTSSARSRTSTGSARPRSSPSTAVRSRAFDVPAVRAFIRIFAPRRGEIVVDGESLDLRLRRAPGPDPNRPKAPRRRTAQQVSVGRAAGRALAGRSRDRARA